MSLAIEVTYPTDRSLSVYNLGRDLHDGLEFVALLLMLMASAAFIPESFLGRPLDLPTGAILIAKGNQDSCRRWIVLNNK